MPKSAPFVVFGAGENPSKGLLCYPSKITGGWDLKILQLTDAAAVKPGEKFDLADVDGEYFTIHFCTTSSIRIFIEMLQEALKRWEGGGKTNEANQRKGMSEPG